MGRFALSIALIVALLPSATIAQSSQPATTQADRVFITGEVPKPGVYPLNGPNGPMTVLSLLSASGGLLTTADLHITLVSGTAKDATGKALTSVVNFDDIRRGKNLAKNNVELRAGDALIVQKAKR